MKTYGLIGRNLTHSFADEYFTEKFEKEEIKDTEYKLFEMDTLMGLPDLIKNEKPEILESIQNTGKIEENTEKLLTEVITNYKKSNFEKK